MILVLTSLCIFVLNSITAAAATPSVTFRYTTDLCGAGATTTNATNILLPPNDLQLEVTPGARFFLPSEEGKFPPFCPELVMENSETVQRKILGRHEIVVHSTAMSLETIEKALKDAWAGPNGKARYPEVAGVRIVRFDDIGFTTTASEPLTKISYIVYFEIPTWQLDVYKNVFDAHRTASAVPVTAPSIEAVREQLSSIRVTLYSGVIIPEMFTLLQASDYSSTGELQADLARKVLPPKDSKPCLTGGFNLRISRAEAVYVRVNTSSQNFLVLNLTLAFFSVNINDAHYLGYLPDTNRVPSAYTLYWHSYLAFYHSMEPSALVVPLFSTPVYGLNAVPIKVQYTEYIQDYLNKRLEKALGLNTTNAFKITLWFNFTGNGTQPQIAIRTVLPHDPKDAQSVHRIYYLDPRLPYVKRVFDRLSQIPVDMTQWELYHRSDPSEIRLTFDAQTTPPSPAFDHIVLYLCPGDKLTLAEFVGCTEGS
ncbi:uncharacterized protein LOC129582773 [Paramacrobiotus metropolitanus]|uniref:uncharacterized protein LOC129582773 n=1 Tax=Paramacrobiotus metropolitanus TaxID=2943436 RepID=UPI002445F9C3|nr:uncharacterized protein LOC129582773 [Paramacrobiotus metropolitanus]